MPLEPTPRTTARVLPVAPDGSVLLLQEQDPARPGELYWASIGGGTDPGESLRAAAVRELHEEAGIDLPADRLVGPVFEHEQGYSWNGVAYAGHHTYFGVRIARDTAVAFDHLEPEEVGNVLGADWWTADDLAGVEHRPAALPDILRTAVAALAETGEDR